MTEEILYRLQAYIIRPDGYQCDLRNHTFDDGTALISWDFHQQVQGTVSVLIKELLNDN